MASARSASVASEGSGGAADSFPEPAAGAASFSRSFGVSSSRRAAMVSRKVSGRSSGAGSAAGMSGTTRDASWSDLASFGPGGVGRAGPFRRSPRDGTGRCFSSACSSGKGLVGSSATG